MLASLNSKLQILKMEKQQLLEVIVYLLYYFNTFPVNCLNSLLKKKEKIDIVLKFWVVLQLILIGWRKGEPRHISVQNQLQSGADPFITGFGQSWSKFGSCHHIFVFRRQNSESKKCLKTLLPCLFSTILNKTAPSHIGLIKWAVNLLNCL